MGSFHFPSLLVLLSHIGLGFCHGDSCKPHKCSKDGPLIQFPFRIKDRQPRHCGYPGFEVSCKEKDTFIHIPPFNLDLSVENIDYTRQMTTMVLDPKECFWRPYMTMNTLINISVSPFMFYSFSNYTFISCSKNVDSIGYYKPISCLSDLEHAFFSVPSDLDVGSILVSCQPVKTIVMPDMDLIYVTRAYGFHNPVYEIGLKWDVPGCMECKMKGLECGFRNGSSNKISCFDPTRHDTGSNREYAIIGASVGFFLLLITMVTSIKVYHSWKVKRSLDLENEIKVEKFLEGYKSLKPTRYSYADLKKMTDQFKEKIGQGGFGSVFKAKLPNGTPVAVKVLKNFGGDGLEFINEVGTIGRIHHVNVVRLLGFSADRLKRALIYEFMPNESLEKYIFSKSAAEDHFFSWEKLQDIAVGVARGIEYLHQGCDQRILHFDIKPQNVLLDQNFNPKISDFGLAKLCSKGQSVVSMAAARGTMGYIAPEVYSRNFGNVSHKSDVYSFGMLLLEMVGGRKNIDATVEITSQVYFPEWIYNRLCQGEDMGLIVTANEDSETAKKLTIVALWCIQWYPVDRPCMKTVVQMFEGNAETLTLPPNPFASTASAKPNLDNIPSGNLSTIAE